ncbi:MAG TPA: hypothetical protein VGI98_07425 [Candidatus Limnocylindrales bacterium]
MTDSGVVDPIRVPDWLRDAVRDVWRETPLLVRVFVGLALLDIVSRGLGFLQPRTDPGLDLFGIYAMFVPHDLWILLPAVLLIRRPDAARATPLVWWGAVIVAAVTAVERPLESLFTGSFGATPMSTEIGILASIAFLVAWLLMARGLAALNPTAPTPQVAGFANLVVGIGAVGLVVQLARSLADGIVTGDPALDGLLVLGNIVAVARLATWLYLLWIVIRGVGDTRRPMIATLAAAIGAAITGLFDAVTTMTTTAMLALQTPGQIATGALGDVTFALALLSVGIGQALIVVAFGLGLAEPPVPYVPPPAVDPVASGGPAVSDAPPQADLIEL